MTASINITLDAKLAKEALERLKDVIGESGAMETIADLLKASTLRRFETKRDPEGNAWAPWSARYAKTRHSNHSLLRDTDSLGDSITRNFTNTTAQVGTNLFYAPYIQEGTDKMPERSFIGLSDDDREDITDAVITRLHAAVRSRK